MMLAGQKLSTPKKMDLKDFEVIRTIGSGAFGRVKVAKQKSNGKLVALKILSKEQMIKHKQVDHIMNEVLLQFNSNHPFLVALHGIIQDSTYLILVQEFVQGGELFTYLRNIGCLESSHACLYAAIISLCFEYLHGKNIIYRDLKPENILIDATGFIMLTDFGFAKIIEGRTYTLCGTPEYLAPEILLNKGHGKAVDWWTLGIFIYELNAGIDPFSADDPMSIYQNILKGKIKFPKSFDKNAKSIVRHLVIADLSKRYGNLKNGVKDIKTHRWFKQIDWDKLFNRKYEMPYIPQIKNKDDISNFNKVSESESQNSKKIDPKSDPFLKWDLQE